MQGRILLVDDDKAMNFLSRLAIKESVGNCQVDECIDGAEAVEYIAKSETCPEVILLDLNMPVMDGFEFLEEFDALGKCGDFSKIYVLTSSSRESDRQRAMKHAAVKGYFDKPLDSAKLKQILGAL